MPVEERLELMATVRADGVHSKRELLNQRVYEGDGVLLRVAAVDAQGPDAGGVVDGRVLVAPQAPTVRASEHQKRHVHLHVVPRHRLLVAVGAHGPSPDPMRESLEAVAAQGAIHGGIGDADAMVSRHIPDDADWSQVGRAPEVKNLLDDDLWHRMGAAVRARPSDDEPGVTLAGIPVSPHVEQGPRNPEMLAHLPDVLDTLRILKDLSRTSDIALGYGHHLPPPLTGQGVQRGLKCLH